MCHIKFYILCIFSYRLIPAGLRADTGCHQTYYDFDRFGWEDSNFIVHPEDYYMAARISKDGMWRVTYGDTAGLTREELLARQPAKFEKMLPGNPKPDQYRVASISPYKIHQRIAEKMRVGRFLLAADAAHLCNPL